ncbi:MAG: type III-B CRISPR module-associated protein Cmr3 [Bryobacterales bacterium]|nr:type III-B CRISPR module-associated protein Cmr3 [Bryobacterales bacterium]
MKTIGLTLDPLDTLFFRGGRPFGSGLPGESSLPSPQSLAGVIRTFLLDREDGDFAAMRNKSHLPEAFAAAGAAWLADVCFRGPWLAELGQEGIRPWFRAPADLRFVDGGVTRLLPKAQKIPGWRPALGGMRPLWSAGGKPSKRRPELLSIAGLAAYLANGVIQAEHVRPYDEFFLLEDRTGIEIDSTTCASKEGEIYSTRNLRLRRDVVFYGEADVPDNKIMHFEAPAAVGWGGERHYAIMRRVAPVQWPESPGHDRTSLLLLSPAFFNSGWRPDLVPEGQLRSAAVDGPYAISGWDLARGGPKPTRLGVDAGSVYFIEGPAPRDRYLGTELGDAALGYGFFVKGSWNYASE